MSVQVTDHGKPGKRTRTTNAAVPALLPLAIIVLVFFVVPILGMVISSLTASGGRGEAASFTFDNYLALSTGNRSLAAQNSIVVSAASATVAALVGLVVSWAISHIKAGWLDQLTGVLSSVLANSGGASLAFSFIVLVGNAGYLIPWVLGIDPSFSLYTVQGLILMYQYFLIPTMVLLMLPSFHGLRDSWKEANTSLGGSPWTFWSRVGFPILAPTVLGAWVLLFGSAFATHASAAVLMGAGTFPLVTLQIANELSGSAGGSQNVAMAMGVVTMVVAVITLVAFNWLQNRSQRWLAK